VGVGLARIAYHLIAVDPAVVASLDGAGWGIERFPYGRQSSSAKAQAARLNGKNGGRPRKVAEVL
jgi:hypothetical protein